jgi:hypothetical protein
LGPTFVFVIDSCLYRLNWQRFHILGLYLMFGLYGIAVYPVRFIHGSL